MYPWTWPNNIVREWGKAKARKSSRVWHARSLAYIYTKMVWRNWKKKSYRYTHTLIQLPRALFIPSAIWELESCIWQSWWHDVYALHAQAGGRGFSRSWTFDRASEAYCNGQSPMQVIRVARLQLQGCALVLLHDRSRSCAHCSVALLSAFLWRIHSVNLATPSRLFVALLCTKGHSRINKQRRMPSSWSRCM